MKVIEIQKRKKRCVYISLITTCLVITVAAIIAGIVIGRVNNAGGRVEGTESTTNIRDLIPTTAEELTNAGLDTLSDIVRPDEEEEEEEEDDSQDETNVPTTSDTINIPLPEEGQEIDEELIVQIQQLGTLEVPGEELQQIVVDCAEIASQAIAFAADVRTKILGSSAQRSELIDEITLLQEEFTLFPGQDDGHSQTEHWMAWLAAPDVAVDDNAMENLQSIVYGNFVDDDGTFYAPNEVLDKFTRIFDAREAAGANDNDEAVRGVISGIPPFPTLKDETECGEAGIAIINEITGDLFDLVGLESLNLFLLEVRDQLADLIDEQRTDIDIGA